MTVSRSPSRSHSRNSAKSDIMDKNNKDSSGHSHNTNNMKDTDSDLGHNNGTVSGPDNSGIGLGSNHQNGTKDHNSDGPNKDHSPVGGAGGPSGRSSGRPRGGGKGKGGAKGSVTVWAGGLPLDIEEEKLHRVFQRFGRVVDVRLKLPGPGSTNPPFAFIEYQHPDDADEAVHALDQSVELGRDFPIKVSLSTSAETRGEPVPGPIHGHKGGGYHHGYGPRSYGPGPPGYGGGSYKGGGGGGPGYYDNFGKGGGDRYGYHDGRGGMGRVGGDYGGRRRSNDSRDRGRGGFGGGGFPGERLGGGPSYYDDHRGSDRFGGDRYGDRGRDRYHDDRYDDRRGRDRTPPPRRGGFNDNIPSYRPGGGYNDRGEPGDSGGKFGGGKGFAAVNKGQYQISLDNLPHDMSWTELKELGKQFTEIGQVTFARTYRKDGISCGILEFKNREDADAVISKLHGKKIKGHDARLVVAHVMGKGRT